MSKTEPPHLICKKCGYDHNYPNGMEEAVRILACALPEYNFITAKGNVPKTKEEELKGMSKQI